MQILYSFSDLIVAIQLFNVWVSPPGTNNLEEHSFNGCQFDKARQFHLHICRVRHIKCYRAIAIKLLIISKNVSGKSFSVQEGFHTGPPYFFIGVGAEATSRSTPLF